MKLAILCLAALSVAMAWAGTCIIDGSLDRPVAGTTTSDFGTCATAIETGDSSRAEPSVAIPLDVVERTADDGLLAGAFDSRSAGFMIIVR